jgi:hypothetical protein
MPTTRIVLTALGALVLAGPVEAEPAAQASGASAADAPASAAAAWCGPPGRPLFGITRIDARRTLARLRPRTLRPRPAPRVRVPPRVVVSGAAFSPGCDAVALPVHRGGIVLVDLERGRKAGSLTLGGRAAVGRLAWPRPDRLMGLSGAHGSQRVVTVSVPDGRLVAVRHIGGRPSVAEATSLGLFAVTGPSDRIGAATLTFATPDGGLLRAPLSRIRAGYEDRGPRAPAREVTPGLAVDEASARAYVVSATEPLVAEVDLASGAMSYHELRGGGGSAGPDATAADRVPVGPYRVARWIGDGTIAVAGGEIRPRRNWSRLASRGLPATRVEPSGLRFIRTADWSERTLDPLLAGFVTAGPVLTGMRSAPTTSPSAPRATGLAAYEVGGAGVFARLRGTRPASLHGAGWPFAYVTSRFPRITYVVDLRTGRTVNTIPARRPPALLVR